MRRSGVLLPVTSLPSRFGIGTFSKEAYAFVDFLKEAGQKLWQILPLGPTGYGDSPYQAFSTFAGNPYLIDLEELIENGWLTEEECENTDWGGASFLEWDAPLKLREPEAIRRCRHELSDEICFWQFLQYLFAKQWQALKAYANGKGISIIGDIPIYVALDSADTWSHPELFQLSEGCVPKAVAGVPPDAFSATGQLWGNPLYDWEYHRKTGYDWWILRIGYSYRLYDIVRVDHFRGFEAYFSIPYGDETAVNGHWEKGPDFELFAAMKMKLGKKEMIAEDLGVITPPVRKMIKKCGYPGMKVLQFAFDSYDSEYLPHNYDKNCIVYTGTHDNQTTRGWYEENNRKVQKYIREYLRVKSGKDVVEAMIATAMSSTAGTAVIPMQDWLGLGREARMNFPSTLGDNWKWRLTDGQLTDALAAHMKDVTKTYCR